MATVRQLRLRARMNTVELSRESNVSLSTINRIENNRGTTNELTLLKLLDVLNARLDTNVSLGDLEDVEIKKDKPKKK